MAIAFELASYSVLLITCLALKQQKLLRHFKFIFLTPFLLGQLPQNHQQTFESVLRIFC
jgi:hypothetical protein